VAFFAHWQVTEKDLSPVAGGAGKTKAFPRRNKFTGNLYPIFSGFFWR
jgi:hypothetical protein